MKPPGAPEVPMDARKRKGLIGTKVRGKILRGPGARCVVQIFEKRPKSKCVFGPNKATNMIPDPLTILTATASSKKCSGGVWGRPDWLKIFRPGHPLGADFKVALKIPLARAHPHRLCGEAGDRGGGMRPEWALNLTPNATSLAMRR